MSDRYLYTAGLASWMIEYVEYWADQMASPRQLILITGEGENEFYHANKPGTTRLPRLNRLADVRYKESAGSFA